MLSTGAATVHPISGMRSASEDWKEPANSDGLIVETLLTSSKNASATRV